MGVFFWGSEFPCIPDTDVPKNRQFWGPKNRQKVQKCRIFSLFIRQFGSISSLSGNLQKQHFWGGFSATYPFWGYPPLFRSGTLQKPSFSDPFFGTCGQNPKERIMLRIRECRPGYPIGRRKWIFAKNTTFWTQKYRRGPPGAKTRFERPPKNALLEPLKPGLGGLGALTRSPVRWSNLLSLRDAAVPGCAASYPQTRHVPSHRL